MYMDGIGLFAKMKKKPKNKAENSSTRSQNIHTGHRNGIWHRKCPKLVMKSGILCDKMELPSQDKIRKLGEKETYKYLGILEADTVKQEKMKDKIKKEYLRRTRKLLVTKLCSRNLIKRINTWAVPLVRYLGPLLKWTRIDQRTRKLMIMHSALHPRNDVDILYVSRNAWGRGLAIIKDSVDASIQRLKDYIEKHKDGLIIAIGNDIVNTVANWMTVTIKRKLVEKQLYGRFKRLINVSHEKTWMWLRKGNLKRGTESLLVAAQNNAIRTNHIKARKNKTHQNSKCWLCGDRDETINYIINECSRLPQKVY